MIRWFALLCFSFFLPLSTVHATALSGSIDSVDNGGMYATGSWDDGGATLDFTATDIGGLWKYVYTFAVDQKALSHIVFQVSDNFTAANVFAGTTAGWSLGDWGDEGGSSPGIPESFYGLKFDGDFSLNNVLTIISDRAPMWGDFYAKDGVNRVVGDSLDVYAFNSSFGTVLADPYQYFVAGKVLVPNTHVTSVPEPSVAGMLAVGVMSMLWVVRRKSQLS